MTNDLQIVRGSGNAPQLVPHTNSMPSPQEWSTIFQMAEALVPTGFLPKAVNTPAKAAAIMLKGRELGVPPMAALGGMAVINGKVTVMADLMLAMIKRRYGRDVIWVESSTDQACKLGYRAAGAIRFYEYTYAMAEKAGLTSNSTYQQHPAAMLRARCVSAVGKLEFPEVTAGLYVPGELGDDVEVDESTGEIITVSLSPSPQTEQFDHGNEMRRMHAIAANAGISHEMISAVFKSKGKEGTASGTVHDFRSLSKKIEANPQGALQWMSSLLSAQEEQALPSTNQESASVAIDDDEVRKAKRDVWEIAVDGFGWTSDQLNAVASKFIGVRYSDANAEQLNKLYVELVTADEAKRDELLKAA